MKFEFWQMCVFAALAICVVKILELNTAQQRQNAYQQGQLDAKNEQIEYLQGKDSNRYW